MLRTIALSALLTTCLTACDEPAAQPAKTEAVTQSAPEVEPEVEPPAEPEPEVEPEVEPPPSEVTAASIVFLHHSVGGGVWDGGVEQRLAEHNDATGVDYQVQELAFPDDPYPWDNYPYDYWRLWVDPSDRAPYMEQPTLENLAEAHDVIVFKHCFPAAVVEADTGNPDVASDVKSLENYKAQYAALLEKMHSFGEVRFIVWTSAAMTAAAMADSGGSDGHAQRSRQFAEWVKEVWDQPGDNVFVFDFYELETEGGVYLLDEYAEHPSDPHPNEGFAAEVAPRFAARIIDVVEGRGDTGSLTGD